MLNVNLYATSEAAIRVLGVAHGPRGVLGHHKLPQLKAEIVGPLLKVVGQETHLAAKLENSILIHIPIIAHV